MSLLPSAVPLHDIDDAEAFVRTHINKAGGLVLTRDEREELIAEGLVILCDLARRYKPRLDGYKRDGSFAGYATNLLGRKLSDAYHRQRENHLCRTQPDGTRKIEYLPRAESYERVTSPRNNGHQVTTNQEATMRHPGNFITVPTTLPHAA